MPVLDSYLFFDGNCAEAMRFYERTLGGKIQMLMTHEQSPERDRMAPEDRHLVMHANMRLGDRTLMASDVPRSMGPKPMAGFSLSLAYEAPEEARRIFDALAEGGQVTMPMTKTFWAEAFGMLVDRFGTPWMVNGGMHAM